MLWETGNANAGTGKVSTLTIAGSAALDLNDNDLVVTTTPTSQVVNYVVTGYCYKVAVEVLVMPITYRVIALVKRHEPTYG